MTVEAAWLANTNPTQGLKRALIVKLGSFHLTSIHPSTHVYIAQQDHTRTRPGLCVSHVPRTHFLWTGVTTSLHVHVILGGREQEVTAMLVCPANTNKMLGLIRALTVRLANIPFSPIQQRIHV